MLGQRLYKFCIDLQSNFELTSENKLLLDKRLGVFELVTGRLRDNALNVRINALKLLVKLIEPCPFVAFEQDKARLNISLFKSRLAQIEETFKVKDIIKFR